MKKIAVIFGIILLAAACGSKSKGEAEVEKLYAQGQLALNQAKYDSALAVYDTILKKFPNHPKNDRALFMLAYIEKEFLGNDAKAEQYLNDLIARYPKSDLIKDAKFLLSGQPPKI